MEELDKVADWMTRQGLGDGSVTDVTEITGGTQNILIRFRRDGRDYVFRRGPRHLRPVSNKVILRETRVLAALAGSDVPHPRLIAACDDTSVLGDAVFYLMEPIDGFNAGQGLPPLHAGSQEIQHGMGLSMASSLAKLHAVDYRAVGLDGFGKPDGFLERQVPRWSAELESYAALDNYDGHNIPGVDELAAWLRERVPAHWSPGIMHGDYHAGNVMFSPTGPELVAIVDWEMCTIGDPLLDLGWLLATWPIPGSDTVLGNPLMAAPGLPSADELVAEYAGNTSRDLSELQWYTAMACFKSGVILEGSNARAAGGQASREVGDYLHRAALLLFERGVHVINTN
ncbi:hypothetical protein MBRU_09480 [Mycolicibacterium brumae DSM 44177]|nr:hypothetical protein MBRU_09480 [Mycolicibacterium brumae DSM 44177]